MSGGHTPGQISLLRDIRLRGAINALLFSRHRSHGPSLRDEGLICGVGDSTAISSLGFEALKQADAALYRPDLSTGQGEG